MLAREGSNCSCIMIILKGKTISFKSDGDVNASLFETSFYLIQLNNLLKFLSNLEKKNCNCFYLFLI